MAELNMGIFPQYKTPAEAQTEGLNYGQRVQDLAYQNQQRQATLQAGQSYATGDYNGAAQALARSGNIGDAQKVQQTGASLNAAGQEYLAKVLPTFTAIAQKAASDPDGGAAQRSQAFDHIAGEAQQMTGASPQAMQAIKQQWVSDPQSFLARLDAAIPYEYKPAGDSLFQFRQGKLTGTYTGLKTITAPATDNVLQVGGQGSPNLGTSATPPAPATIAAPMQGPPPQGAPGQQVASAAPPGAPGQPAAPAAPINPSSDQVAAAITKYIPGSIITSTGRTPQQNAAVGGVPDSMHLNAQAIDFVMPKGVTFDQVKQLVQQSGLPVTELLNEGSHVHIGWGPKGGQQAAPQQIAQAGSQPQPQDPALPPGVTMLQRGQPAFRPPTDAEKAQYPGISQMGANGKAEYPPLSAVGAGMNNDQLQPLVDILKAGGTLPQRAMSNPQVYSHILQLAQEQGVPPQSILANQGVRKATQATFGQVNTRYAMVQTQEQAFQNSLNLAYKLAQTAGPQGGGTLINGWRNYIKTGLVGDPKTGAFINAVNTAMNEYGKIIEGSTGNAGSSISARADANNMLSGADNLPAFVEKMKVLQADAGYKIGALKDQHDTLLKTLGGVGLDQSQGSPAPANVIRYDAKGNRL